LLLLMSMGWSQSAACAAMGVCVVVGVLLHTVFVHEQLNKEANYILKVSFCAVTCSVICWFDGFAFVFPGASPTAAIFLGGSCIFLAALSVSGTVTDSWCTILASNATGQQSPIVLVQLILQRVVGGCAGPMLGRVLYTAYGWDGYLLGSLAVLLVAQIIIMQCLPNDMAGVKHLLLDEQFDHSQAPRFK